MHQPRRALRTHVPLAAHVDGVVMVALRATLNQCRVVAQRTIVIQQDQVVHIH